MRNAGTAPRIALVAAGGLLPVALAQRLSKEDNKTYHVFGIRGLARADDFKTESFSWLQLGKISPLLRTIRHKDLTHICLAGSIKRPRLKDLRLDWQGVRLLRRIAIGSDGDNALLERLVHAIKDLYCLDLIGPDQLLPNWLVESEGCLTSREPNHTDFEDISQARRILTSLAKYDIGQALVIHRGRVLAMEAALGTQAMLSQLATHRDISKKAQQGVLVKGHKITQNRQVDLPCIGPDTVTQAKAAGLSGIVIEAKFSLILAKQDVIAKAEQAGLFVYIMPTLSGES